MVFGRGPHQRRLAEPVFVRVDVGATLRQQPTASTLPARAAVISTVSPSALVESGLAPASMSASISDALPLSAASRIGVTP